MNARTLIVEALIERIASWPEAAQEEAVDSLLSIEARHVGTYGTSETERIAILKGLSEADRGEFVGDAEMTAFFKRHGL